MVERKTINEANREDKIGLETYVPGTDITLDDRMVLQRTFLYTEDGKQTLKWLLFNLGLYREVACEGDSAKHGFALKIMNVLGLLDGDNTEAMIDSLGEIVRKDALHPGRRYSMKEGIENVRPHES